MAPSRVVLVTGGARGIGRACVEAYRESGAEVVAADIEACEDGAASLTLRADLAQQAGRRQVVLQTLDRFGRIDVLVNCAGIGLYAHALETPDEPARRTLHGRPRAPMFACAGPEGRDLIAGKVVSPSTPGPLDREKTGKRSPSVRALLLPSRRNAAM